MRSLHRFALPFGCLFAAWLGGASLAVVAHGAKRDETPHAAVEQIAKVLVQIENRYVDPVDRQRILEGAIKGMVAELDPHSEYFSPQEYLEFTHDTEGKFGGVGIEVDARGEYMVVIAPIEGGPAEAAGILAGDEIVSIDGRDAKGASLEKSVRTMRGAPGTKIELVIRRRSDGGKLFRVPLVRREIRVPSVDDFVLPGGIAYLRVRQFQEHTHSEFVDAVARMKSKTGGKLAGVVIDLRRNPGGLVDQAVEVADELLESGVIFSTRGQVDKTVEEVKASAGGVLANVATAILVDEGSASAAELLAGALQDHRRATVVGATTFGKGSVQTLIALSGGAGMKLTTARYYTPSGRSIQGHGIEPDVLVESSRVVDPKGPSMQKEKDLPHALLGEGAASASPHPSTAIPAGLAELPPAGGQTGGQRNSPSAPTATSSPHRRAPALEKDFQLHIAHQIVSGVLSRRTK